MGFLLRKTVSAFVMPLPLAVVGVLVGCVLWWRGRRTRLGRAMVLGSVAFLWMLSVEPVSRRFAEAVQGDVPPFPGDSVAFVVVLGAGHDSGSDLPLTAQLQPQALYRITEGVRVAVAQPWARLVVSGYGGTDPKPNAQVYGEVATALGLDPARLILEPRPMSTAQEAELLAPLLGDASFALVTSATHMPRALALFRARGLDPTPAPTGHLTRGTAAPGAQRFIPSATQLERSRTAWYEVLGRVWARLRGDI